MFETSFLGSHEEFADEGEGFAVWVFFEGEGDEGAVDVDIVDVGEVDPGLCGLGVGGWSGLFAGEAVGFGGFPANLFFVVDGEVEVAVGVGHALGAPDVAAHGAEGGVDAVEEVVAFDGVDLCVVGGDEEARDDGHEAGEEEDDDDEFHEGESPAASFSGETAGFTGGGRCDESRHQCPPASAVTRPTRSAGWPS